jgi:hypothetical protein
MSINKNKLLMSMALLTVFMLLSCAPGNERWNQEIALGHKAGFLAGLWHGLIIIVTFIVSLFNKNVGIYEVHNTGWSYNLGYLIGLLSSVGGGIRASTRRWKKKQEKP